MGKPDPPEPPDYTAAAEQTAAGNLELVEAQTAANRPNQYTPWGSSEWSQDAEGNWSQNINLSGPQQGALDDQMNIQGARSGLGLDMFDRVGEEFGSPMDWDQFGEYQSGLGSGDDARQNAIDEMYGQATSRLDPMWEQNTENQLDQLRNQGLRPGDEAFDNATERLENQKTDAYSQAMFAAVRHGGAEGSRVFDINRSSAAFDNTVRQSQISEEMQRRGFSLNEINAILSGQQIQMPGMPGFNSAERSQGTDYSGAVNSQFGANMDVFSARQGQSQMLMEGVTGMGSMMFSDIRLKSNIKRIGSYKGHNLYSYIIWGKPAIGVMAHEMPLEHVALHESGYFMVDYGSI